MTTQDELLDGARACLRRLGYRGTTARAIAAETGRNLRSIGYHYGSVRGLVLTALSQNFREWLAPLIAPAADPAALRAGIADFTASYAANAPLVSAWLQAVGDARDDDELRRTLAANQEGFRARFAENLRAAGVADADEAAAAIVTVCDGLMVRQLLHGAAPPVGDVAARAAKALGVLDARAGYGAGTASNDDEPKQLTK